MIHKINLAFGILIRIKSLVYLSPNAQILMAQLIKFAKIYPNIVLRMESIAYHLIFVKIINLR